MCFCKPKNKLCLPAREARREGFGFLAFEMLSSTEAPRWQLQPNDDLLGGSAFTAASFIRSSSSCLRRAFCCIHVCRNSDSETATDQSPRTTLQTLPQPFATTMMPTVISLLR